MKRTITWIMSILVGFLCFNFIEPYALAAETANLVENASFESPEVTELVSFNKSIPGWHLYAGSIIEVDKKYISSTFDGSQLIELDGIGVTGIYQDIVTEPEQEYTLTFAFKANPSASENKLNVVWGNTIIANLLKTEDDTEWQVYNYNVKATGTTTRLRFDNLNEASDGVGTYIDGVKLTKKMPPQYASSVINFSSQWSTSGWSATQTLGAPDNSSWCAATANKDSEHLTLGFAEPVYASGVKVHETSGQGYLVQVDVVDTDDNYHTVWQGTDPVGSDNYSTISWEPTSFLVKGVKLYIDSNLSSTWEYVESVQLL